MKQKKNSKVPAQRRGRTEQNREAGVPPRGNRPALAAPRDPAEAAAPAPPFPFEAVQQAARQRLNPAALQLFHQSTGFRLHLHWHGPLDFRTDGPAFLLCPRAVRAPRDGEPSHEPPFGAATFLSPQAQPSCGDRNVAAARFKARSAALRKTLPARCQNCLRQHWDAPGPRRCFAAPCGAASCWSAIAVGPTRLGTIVLQARRGGAAFQRAVAFLEMLLHDLDATIRAELAEQALARARHSWPSPSAESGLRSGGPSVLLPAPIPAGAGPHARQIAERMLEYIQAHYQKPLQLADLAAALQMNSSYLSAVFSRTMGIPFHRYLEQLRLAKAKELLSEPTHRVCEAARAAGYENPNRFRSVFKVREGMSPSEWRENPPPAPPRPTL